MFDKEEEEEYICINEIQTKNISLTDTNINLYQVQGILNTNKCIIRYIGHPSINNANKYVVLKEFSFFDYDCMILSHLLSQDDIINNHDKQYKMLSISMSKNSATEKIISFVFESKDNISIDSVGKEIEGVYKYIYVSSNDKKILKPIVNRYQGNDKIIYELINKLSVVHILN